MRKKFLIFVPLLVLTACATTPTGPSVLVLPGTGKNFEQFNRDDLVCRDFALRGLSAVSYTHLTLPTIYSV